MFSGAAQKRNKRTKSKRTIDVADAAKFAEKGNGGLSNDLPFCYI